MFILRLLPALFLLSSFTAGCDSDLTAHVTEAEQVSAGSRVMLAGVQVGEVRSLGVGSGPAPVVVVFALEGDNAAAIEAGACAKTTGDTLELFVGDRALPLVDGEIAACAPTTADILEGMIEDVTQGVSTGAGSLTREAARQAAEQLRGAFEGFNEGAGGAEGVRDLGRTLGMQARELGEGIHEGLGPDGVRELGRAVGMDTREFGEGLEEGLAE